MRRRQLAAAAVLFLVFGTGPTVGDVGGCGSAAAELDYSDFVRARKVLDCQRCVACGIHTVRCTRACDPAIPGEIRFPTTCRPLAHDGDVCIHALYAASCETFATYVDDNVSEVPSECEFCRVSPAPTPTLQTGGP